MKTESGKSAEEFYNALAKDYHLVYQVTSSLKTITFQLWDWRKDNTYIVNHFTLKGLNNEFETSVRKAEYAAFSHSEMNHIFQEAGFSRIEWLMPDKSGFYQPIFIATP